MAENDRFPVKLFPSATATDVIFYVIQGKRLDKRKIPTYGTPYNDITPRVEDWPDHKLVYIAPADDSGDQRWYFAADRENQDAYNFEFTKADIGGTKFDAVRRTYLTPRADFDPDTPAMGASMPNVPTSMFGTGTGTPSVISGYVLADRAQSNGAGNELDSLYVVEVLTYVKRTTNRVLRFDEETTSTLYVESNLYYGTEIVSGGLSMSALFAAPTNAYWGLDATGLFREGRQLSSNWYEVTTTQVVPGNTASAITGSISTGIPLRAFDTEQDYSWPAILRTDFTNTEFSNENDIVFAIIPRKDVDDDKVFLRLQFANPAYRGPTKMRIEEWWVKTPLAKHATPSSSGGLPESTTMIPVEIEHQGANYSVRIEPTLHVGFTMIDTVGSDSEIYEPDAYGTAYDETVPTEWPESLIIGVDQQPFRGGYKITVVTAYRPDHYVAPTP